MQQVLLEAATRDREVFSYPLLADQSPPPRGREACQWGEDGSPKGRLLLALSMEITNNRFEMEVEGGLVDSGGSPVGLVYGGGDTFSLELQPSPGDEGGKMALQVVTRGTACPLLMTKWGPTLFLEMDRETAFSPGTEGDTTPSDE